MRQSKVHGERDLAPAPDEAEGFFFGGDTRLGVPGAGTGRSNPASSKDRERPGLGPVGTSVRSSLQGGTALVRLRMVRGGQGAGQAYLDGGRGEGSGGGRGGLGSGPGELRRGGFGASLPKPRFNQSRGRE